MTDFTYADMFARLISLTGAFWAALVGVRFAISNIKRAAEYA